MAEGEATLRHFLLRTMYNSTTKAHIAKELWDAELGDTPIKLSASEVSLIEDTDLLSLDEKLELFSIHLGYKYLAEVDRLIPYELDQSDQVEKSNKSEVGRQRSILERLPFPFVEMRYLRPTRQSEHLREFCWFFVCATEKVRLLAEKYSEDFSAIDQGILYGYPPTAVLAFTGVLERFNPKVAPIHEYFLAGVLSRKFYMQESAYFRKWWKDLKKLSPKTISECEEVYRKELER